MVKIQAYQMTIVEYLGGLITYINSIEGFQKISVIF